MCQEQCKDLVSPITWGQLVVADLPASGFNDAPCGQLVGVQSRAGSATMIKAFVWDIISLCLAFSTHVADKYRMAP